MEAMFLSTLSGRSGKAQEVFYASTSSSRDETNSVIMTVIASAYMALIYDKTSPLHITLPLALPE